MKSTGIFTLVIVSFCYSLWASVPDEYDPKHLFLTPDFQQEINTLTHSVLIQGNRFELLIDAEPSLTKKIELAKEAKLEIYISTLVFVTYLDPLMQQLTDILEQKAREGVAVYIIVDDLSAYADRSVLKKLEKSGVHVTYFNPTLDWDSFPINVRMHEKYMVVDHHKIVMGGQNMLDERFKMVPDGVLNWRDTDVYVEGPMAIYLSEHFREVWADVNKQRILHSDRRDAFPIREPTDIHTGEARFMYNEAHTGHKYINAFYLKLIQQAKQEIFWQGNQVALNSEFEVALKEAADRGVKVTLMSNSSSSAWWQPGWYHYYAWVGYRPFRNSKVVLRLYQNRFNHSKIFYVDGVIASIGSFNHDRSSLETDAESCMAIYDKAFIEAIRHQIDIDLFDTKPYIFPF